MNPQKELLWSLRVELSSNDGVSGVKLRTLNDKNFPLRPTFGLKGYGRGLLLKRV